MENYKRVTLKWDADHLDPNDSFDPPPWNIIDFPEKTEGWIERQRWERKQKEKG